VTEDLALTMFDATTGKPVCNGSRIDLALAGAALFDLALAGRVDLVDKRVRARNPAPTGEPFADAALARISAERRPRKPVWWVQKLARGARGRVLGQLVAAGVLQRTEKRVLGIFGLTRYPRTQPALTADPRHLVDAVVRGQPAVRPDQRTAALCALIAAMQVERAFFRDLRGREVRRRLVAAGSAGWAGDAVAAAVQEAITAAVTAAVIGAIAASTAASG